MNSQSDDNSSITTYDRSQLFILPSNETQNKFWSFFNVTNPFEHVVYIVINIHQKANNK